MDSKAPISERIRSTKWNTKYMTPEQNIQLQEILLSNGVRWGLSRSTKPKKDAEFLYVDDEMNLSSVSHKDVEYFNQKKLMLMGKADFYALCNELGKSAFDVRKTYLLNGEPVVLINPEDGLRTDMDINAQFAPLPIDGMTTLREVFAALLPHLSVDQAADIVEGLRVDDGVCQ